MKSLDVISEEFTKIHGECWRDYIYKDEFIPGFRDCYYCEKFNEEVPAVYRISVNVWGVVCERDVCERHASKNGMRVDD
jgi:hypothetical protein